MKTYLFLLGVLAMLGGCMSLEDRMMKMGEYVERNCRGAAMYDSMPAMYTRALDIGRDSADRLVSRWERAVKTGKCPE